jgi:hypothetical protein
MTYKVQIDDLVRDANADEIAFFEDLKAKEAIKIAEIQAKAEAKAELLERLGITEDEAKLLLS